MVPRIAFQLTLVIMVLLMPSSASGQEGVPEVPIPSTTPVGEGFSVKPNWTGSILVEAKYPGTNVTWMIEPSDGSFELPAPYADGDIILRFHYSPTEDIYELKLTATEDHRIEVLGFVDVDQDGLHDDWETEFDVGSPDKDDDGDGLTNIQEMISLSDPRRKDTDGDEMDDFWEYNHGTLPFRHDAYGDPDLDEWTNIKEKVLGTDPRDPDDHPEEAPYTPWYWIVLIFAAMLLILGYFVKQLFNKRKFEDDMEDFDRKNLPRKMSERSGKI